MSTTIVWVEDEQALLAEGIHFLLTEGYEVYGVGSCEEAVELIDRLKPQLLLVDWMLPGGCSGLDLCKRNEREWQLPIIMLTAKGDEFDKVLALELGADDYMAKPYSLRELSARIKAVLRRTGRGAAAADGTGGKAEAASDTVISRGALLIDSDRHQVELNGRVIELTRTEFMLLWQLAKHPGRVYTRTHLMESALGGDYLGFERTIDSHIRNLRRKLEEDPAEPQYIVTVYGVGYKFGETG
ncbi:winged helix-turn-helix domain-containing protein [Paenibacillus xylaniclasticus]|uniref:winged helix-turn-helix domain-containing protein n=1 Tax=Paenibacillus xylaniclasticus TaxID=588083 RepID=UPI000FDB95CC|nr:MULTISPECIES: response regulator transcription factor [Paenibacillus]GFN32051.1 DNA-binding response regulator [Paenibacillus curdlanolyticus]